MTAPEMTPVPLAIVLACSSAAVADVVRARQERGDVAIDPAMVCLSGGRYFASVAYAGASRPALLFALDAWTREPAQSAQDGLSGLRATHVLTDGVDAGGAS